MRRLAFGALASLGLLAAGARAQTPPEGSRYVAMGSSYAAGTSLPSEAADGVARCGQGSENYPRQVARTLRLRLVDRACGGAIVPNLLSAGQFDLPPQIAAVTPDTRLVTITVGGNDVRFVADLGAFSCRLRPRAEGGAACPTAPADFSVDAAFATLDGELRTLTAELRRRAPQARIVFVDYITVLPPEGTCAALGLTDADAADMRARARRLAALTAAVASDGGAELVKASTLSQGHDVCASEPWAWGFVSAEERARTGAVGFHPRLTATTAIAGAVVDHLRTTPDRAPKAP